MKNKNLEKLEQMQPMELLEHLIKHKIEYDSWKLGYDEGIKRWVIIFLCKDRPDLFQDDIDLEFNIFAAVNKKGHTLVFLTYWMDFPGKQIFFTIPINLEFPENKNLISTILNCKSVGVQYKRNDETYNLELSVFTESQLKVLRNLP